MKINRRFAAPEKKKQMFRTFAGLHNITTQKYELRAEYDYPTIV
jgi:hypothetical protein